MSQRYSNTKIRQGQHKENHRSVCLMNLDAKHLDETLANEYNNMLKGSYTMIKFDLSQECKDFSIWQIDQCDSQL